MSDETKPDNDAYLKECVAIEPLAIQEEYVRIPSDLAYWNAQYAKAQREALVAKVNLDVLERELYAVIRGELEAGGARVTEKTIDAGIGRSEAWVEAKHHLAESEAEKAKLYGYLDAVRTKREMLISLGAHLRIEMQGDIRLREESKAFSGKMGFGGG